MTVMSPSALIGVLLIVALATLLPLAQASPPDPLWTGGIFDANDQDDVVVVAASADGATAGDAHEGVEALWVVLGAVSPWGGEATPASIHPSFQGRAPPIV